jgi:BirA family biotin operon repressor/biotin-[acetyl-CoA-carboxylase] ligase
MAVARDMGRKGCPHLTVVVADRQVQGRGRLKRTWLSAGGGLYFTLVLRPEIPLSLAPRLNFLASWVLAQTLQRMYRIDARLKWPNDILVDGKKLCGMLSETEAEADLVSFVNIGIGINVNNDPTKEEPDAISLNKLLGKDISRIELLSEFIDNLERHLGPAEIDRAVSEWKKFTITLNRQVRIVTRRETTEGLAVDVDENGALLLELADGSQKKIFSGDCFL